MATSSKRPLSLLAERMQHDLQLAGMSARTQESYLRAVRKVAHVLPSGFSKVRHYGFASSPKRTNFELLGWIVTLSLSLVYILTVGASQPPRQRGLCCRECGEPMQLVAFLLPMGD